MEVSGVSTRLYAAVAAAPCEAAGEVVSTEEEAAAATGDGASEMAGEEEAAAPSEVAGQVASEEGAAATSEAVNEAAPAAAARRASKRGLPPSPADSAATASARRAATATAATKADALREMSQQVLTETGVNVDLAADGWWVEFVVDDVPFYNKNNGCRAQRTYFHSPEVGLTLFDLLSHDMPVML
jgi:hydroxylamine reductase (hybrid-cluster protein)